MKKKKKNINNLDKERLEKILSYIFEGILIVGILALVVLLLHEQAYIDARLYGMSFNFLSSFKPDMFLV